MEYDALVAPIDTDDAHNRGTAEEEFTGDDTDSEDNYILNGSIQRCK
jgi:hypothetical protein